MLPRVLEPEYMDTASEAADYDAMDHAAVNQRFAEDVRNLLAGGEQTLLDLGTGTALIPIEIACRDSDLKIVATDAASHMLRLAADHVRRAGLQRRIVLVRCDAKRLPFPGEVFDAVISNSIIHHIPSPIEVLREAVRVLRPGGRLFVRDLCRPQSAGEVERLVAAYAGNERPDQQQLFRQSLHAALTVNEMRTLLKRVDWPDSCCEMTSNRHWTISGSKA